MTHASLFSGIGGFDLAAEWAGLTNLFHCEINEFCRKVLQYHFKKAKSYEDIRATDFREWRGQVDVLTGGFPCQPFSVAGQRKGADDDRYLWPEMLRAIREIQPAWVIGENVAGILTMVQPGQETEVGNQQTIFGESDRKRTMLRQQFVVETVCCDLEREGYSVQPFVIPACAVGAPHRRDRVWFVARRDNASDTDINRCWNRENEQKSFCGCEDETDNSFGCQDEPVAYANSNGNQTSETGERIEECRSGKFLQQKERRYEAKWNYGLSGISRNITNAKCDRGNEVDNEIQSEQPKWKGSYSNGYERDASDTQCDGLQQRWKTFPTFSPVCRGNDGIPFNVDCLTLPFNKWRQESVKAYGNAIVPQVAYEIFKAILNNR